MIYETVVGPPAVAYLYDENVICKRDKLVPLLRNVCEQSVRQINMQARR